LSGLRARRLLPSRFGAMLFIGIGGVLNAPRNAASNRRSASCLLNGSFARFAMTPGPSG
jgi:hypothetical protein